MGDKPAYPVDPARYRTDDVLAAGAGEDPATAVMIAECQTAGEGRAKCFTNDGALDKGDALYLRTRIRDERRDEAVRGAKEKLNFARMRAEADRAGVADKGSRSCSRAHGAVTSLALAVSRAKRPLSSKSTRGVQLASIRVSRPGSKTDVGGGGSQESLAKKQRRGPSPAPPSPSAPNPGALGLLGDYSGSDCNSSSGEDS